MLEVHLSKYRANYRTKYYVKYCAKYHARYRAKYRAKCRPNYLWIRTLLCISRSILLSVILKYSCLVAYQASRILYVYRLRYNGHLIKYVIFALLFLYGYQNTQNILQYQNLLDVYLVNFPFTKISQRIPIPISHNPLDR